MYFVSDNAGPVAPQIMDALIAANQGYAMPYGGDAITAHVQARIREIFEAPEALVALVATGTAANSLSLATLANPWEAIFGHRHAHFQEDECGAPEFYTGGAKLVAVDGPHAKIDPDALLRTISANSEADIHQIRRGPLSITQLTEFGTAYTLNEINTLTGIAKSFGLACHMDGSRFANALVAIGCTPAEMTWKSGIDILSLGGAKNGLMGVEAVVMFDPSLSTEFNLGRMRGGHLFSKNRFPAAQMQAYLTDGLWLELAKKSNAAAAQLEAGICAVPGGSLDHPRDANILFAKWPRKGHRAAQLAGAAYYMIPFDQSLDGADDEPLGARLVCNWATTDADIATFLDAIKC